MKSVEIKPEYKICLSTTESGKNGWARAPESQLIYQVKLARKYGWKPIGGVSVVYRDGLRNLIFAQAMVPTLRLRISCFVRRCRCHIGWWWNRAKLFMRKEVLL